MTNQPPLRCMLSLALLLACIEAHAAPWTVCDLAIKVEQVMPSEHRLAARVTKLVKGPSHACPRAGDQMIFMPETLDYQSVLPARLWPRANARSMLRYRYLDGICKARGPCRIEHHSILVGHS